MRKASVFSLVISLAYNLSQAIASGPVDNEILEIKSAIITELPPAIGKEVQPGVAGAFIGVQGDFLIIAGGANFPNGAAWEGGTKVYHDDIYVLVSGKSGSSAPIYCEKRLPTPIGYGASVSTPNGILCLGGTDGFKATTETFFLSIDLETQNVDIKPFVPLPQPLQDFNADIIGTEVYVAGSSNSGSKFFWKINIAVEHPQWEELPVWNGSARTHAIGLVQSNGEEDCFYLLKGRYKGAHAISTMLTDIHEFSPKKNTWREIGKNQGPVVAAGSAISMGANHIILFGGDDGHTFNILEKLGHGIAGGPDPPTLDSLKAIRDSIQINHSGFTRDIWSFHTITHSWHRLGQMDRGQVTTTAVKWGDAIVIPSGEISPCIRTPDIQSIHVEPKTSFGLLNSAVVIIYLLALVVLGFVFSKNQNSTDDFFKAGNRIPWWAAGISIFGTQLSAITFMAIPAKTFATDWLYFFLMMTIIMVMPFIIRFFLPFYRRFNLTTAYEYLELRFNLATRILGASMYILFQIGRLGVVLLLPSLALSVVTSIDVHLCILTMGILSILYTVLGGIEAVIWTDVLQVVVLLGGALVSLAILYFNMDADTIYQHVASHDKMRIFDWSFNFRDPTIWVVVFGGFASNLIQYGSDQTVVQRYLTTKDEAAAAKSIRIGAWLALPSTLIFFTLGTLLFVYFKEYPAQLNPLLEKSDAIFPWYIVSTLPSGISGILIAAIFAASMSSLDSSMNSVATVVTTDYIKRLGLVKQKSNLLGQARICTVIVGLVGTALALLMASWGISSLWDQFNTIIGLFIGGLGGIFLLGIFFNRANGRGALMGLLLSALGQYVVQAYTDLHFLFYAFTGIAIAIGFGLLFSIGGQDPVNSNIYSYSQISGRK